MRNLTELGLKSDPFGCKAVVVDKSRNSLWKNKRTHFSRSSQICSCVRLADAEVFSGGRPHGLSKGGGGIVEVSVGVGVVSIGNGGGGEGP